MDATEVHDDGDKQMHRHPDEDRVQDVAAGTVWDPRANLDDDGDVDAADQTAYAAKDDNWPPLGSPTVKQAFSDVDNPFMFQGRPHFAFDTEASATEGVLMLNDHRGRDTGVVTGRWITRDPVCYAERRLSQLPVIPDGARSLDIVHDRTTGAIVVAAQGELVRSCRFAASNPGGLLDPSGLKACVQACSIVRNCCKTAGLPARVCDDTAPALYAACMAVGNSASCGADWNCTICGGTCTICLPPWTTPSATNPLAGTSPAGDGSWLGIEGKPNAAGNCAGSFAPPDDYCDCPPGSS